MFMDLVTWKINRFESISMGRGGMGRGGMGRGGMGKYFYA